MDCKKNKIPTTIPVRRKKRMISDIYFNYFYGIYLTRFTWDNLPSEILPQAIEDFLFWDGSCYFFKHQPGDFFAVMRGNTYGTIDIYGFGNERMAYANQYVEFLQKDDSVMIRDTYSGYPMAEVMRLFADSIADMRITRDINIRAQRTPYMFSGNANQANTLNTIYDSVDRGVPYIPLDKNSVNKEDLTCLVTNAPMVFRDVSEEMRHEIVSCLNMMGVYATHSSKRERQTSAESVGNAGEVEMARNGATDLRLRAANQINKMFGLNIKPRFNSLLPLPIFTPEQDGNYTMQYDNVDKTGGW